MTEITRDNINRMLSRLQNGEDCLIEFIDYSCGYIKYIAYNYLSDKSFVEDVVFLTYHKILQAIKVFDNSKNGLAWIRKITKNEALRINRDEVITDADLETYKYNLKDVLFTENERLIKFDVERAMDKLDEQERFVIKYKIIVGMTVREIAKKLNKPKSTVADILKHALNKLKKELL